MDIIAARHCQRAAHQETVRRNLPTLLRIDTESIDPIVDAWAAEEVLNPIHGVTLVGFYVRQEWGKEQIANPVYAGDSSPLFTDGANLVRCEEDGAF